MTSSSVAFAFSSALLKSITRYLGTLFLRITAVPFSSTSLVTFEKSGTFNGVYHVLGGLISPMDGINPNDLSIDSLINRIKSLDNPEVILALRSSIDGEMTMLYLKSKP